MSAPAIFLRVRQPIDEIFVQAFGTSGAAVPHDAAQPPHLAERSRIDGGLGGCRTSFPPDPRAKELSWRISTSLRFQVSLGTYLSPQNWKTTPITFLQATTKEKTGVHNHFVLCDFTGHGLYIVRDQYRNEVHRRECSIYDLGQLFAEQVMKALPQP